MLAFYAGIVVVMFTYEFRRERTNATNTRNPFYSFVRAVSLPFLNGSVLFRLRYLAHYFVCARVTKQQMNMSIKGIPESSISSKLLTTDGIVKSSLQVKKKK